MAGNIKKDIFLTQARKYMKVAVTKLKEAGDDNLDFLEFPEQNHADGLGCGFQQLVATAADLVGKIGGDRHLLARAVLVRERSPVDQVHVAAEHVGLPDGQLQRGNLVPERRRRASTAAIGQRSPFAAVTTNSRGSRRSGQ
jgi:hypothetical protein